VGVDFVMVTPQAEPIASADGAEQPRAPGKPDELLVLVLAVVDEPDDAAVLPLVDATLLDPLVVARLDELLHPVASISAAMTSRTMNPPRFMRRS
jgi:hypothetical protein